MVERDIDVANIRFTQEHVYDSFNANDSRAMDVVEFIEAILAGKMTPRDLPLIRVAAKKGAYWCVDNRRLFVYKHCQLGAIPVEVFDWKDNREFELKWKNGLASRGQSGGGRRVGMIQRTEKPFPRSAVVEVSMQQINTYYSPEEQRRHDAAIASLKERRQAIGAGSADIANQALRELLSTPAKKGDSAVRKKKRVKGTKAKTKVVMDSCADPAACDVVSTLKNDGTSCEASHKLKRRKKKTKGSGVVASAKSAGVTVGMAGDGSDDDYEVDVVAL